MNELLQIFQALRAIAPLIPEAIQLAETLCPPGSAGATKLATAQAFVQNAYEQLGNAQDSFQKMLPSITTAINATVAAYNAVGALKKAAPAA
jgi:hypothetical protein